MRKRGYSKPSIKWKGVWNFRYLLIFIFLISLVFVVFALPTVTIVSPTLANNSYTNNNWVFVNITSDEDLNQSLLEWGNSTGFTNVSMSNSSSTNWYKNMTNLSDYAYNYTIWAQNTSGNWNQSTRYFVTVDTIDPAIEFDSSTTANASTQTSFRVNITASDTNDLYVANDLDNSIVGWWRFEELNASNDPTDDTGINNGSAQGGASQTDAGRFGKGFSFDGADDYVEIADDSSLHFNLSGLTVSMWVKKVGDQADSYGTLIEKAGNGVGSRDFQFHWVKTTNIVNFRLRNGSSDEFQSSSNSGLSTDEWHYIVGTWDTSIMTLYIDGIAQTDTESLSNLNELNPDIMRIGRLTFDSSSNYHFNGSIDEVIIFNRSLSLNEIQALYNATRYDREFNSSELANGVHTFTGYAVDQGGNKNETELREVTIDTVNPGIEFKDPTPSNATTQSATSVYVNVSTSDSSEHSAFIDWNYSLVGWWKMDEYNSSGIYDNSSYDNFGTFQGGLGTGDLVNAKRGKGLEFDGVDDYIDVGNDGSLDATNIITISAWIKTPTPNARMTIYSTGYTGTGIVFGTSGKEEGLEVYYPGVYVADAKGNLLSSNTWHHVLYTRNGSDSGTHAFYIDGVSKSLSIDSANNFSSTTVSKLIGVRTGSTYPFNGSIDEVMIFNRALSPEEINASYQAGTYRLYRNFTSLSDGVYNYTAHVIDEAGNTNETEERTVTVDGHSPPTVTLNSPVDDTYSSNTTQIFNCSAVDTNLNTQLANITFYWNYSGNFIANGSVDVSGESNSTNFTRTSLSEGSIIIWNCYACDNSSNCDFASENYTLTIDAVNPDIEYVSPTLANDTTTSNTSIEINVSITELNLNEVKFNWNTTNYTFYNDSLVLMFNFDNVSAIGENSNYAVDVSNYGNDGTTSGDPVMNLTGGRYGGAFEFDGSDDYIDVGNDASLDATNIITISAWIKTPSPEVRMTIYSTGYTEQGINFGTFVGGDEGLEVYYPGVYVASVKGPLLSSNTWHHVLYTRNGSGSGTHAFYVDGVSKSLHLDSAYNFSSTTASKFIGSRPNSYAPFNGTIDEVRIWNRSLSAAEIQQHYMSNLRKYDTDKWALYVNQSKDATTGLEDGTYTYYSYAKDTAGNENSTETREVTIDMPSPPTVTLNSPVDDTYSSNTTQMFNCSAVDTNFNTQLANITFYWDYSGSFIANGTVDVSGESNSTNFTRTSLSEGSIIIWNCYACDNSSNCDFASENYTLTIDAVNPGINFTSPTPANDTTTSNTSIEINVSITELNLNEVKFNWNTTNYTFYNDSLVLMFNFDNVSAIGENDTYVVDVSGYGNDGTVNSTTVVSGKYGNARNFAGTTADYIEKSSVSDFPTDEITIVLWLNTTGSGDGIVSYAVSGSGLDNEFLILSQNNLDIYRGNYTDNTGGTGVSVNDGNWHYLAVTWQGTDGAIKIYKDGVEEFSDTLTSGTSISAGGCLVIGQDQDSVCGGFNSGQAFNGTIDELRIYNRILSAAEIQQHYMSNLNKYDTNKWILYVNQSKNATTGLEDGTYTYYSYAKDTAGNTNETELRTVTIEDTTPTLTISPVTNRKFNNNFTLDVNCTPYNSSISISEVKYNLNDGSYISLTAPYYSTLIDITTLNKYTANTFNIACTDSLNQTLNSLITIYRDDLFWGDPHTHSEFSDGTGTPAANFIYARDTTEIDFHALTDHDGSLTAAEWEAVKGNASLFNVPNRFIAISGFEWSAGTAYGGHKPVYFKYDNGTLCQVGSSSCNTPDELYQSLANEGEGNALSHAAHPTLSSLEANWSYFNETYQPNTEMIGIGNGVHEYGSNSVNYALLLGYKFGFVGVSDTHSLKPGASGLTACYADNLTREGIFNALKNRKCYATSSAQKIRLKFDIKGHDMGSEFYVQNNTNVTANIVVNGTTSITSITFIKNNITIGSKTDCATINCSYSLNTTINETSYIYVRVIQSTGRAYASPIFITPVLISITNFDGTTTDLTIVNISYIRNFIIEKTSYGKINFSEPVNLSGGADLNTYVNISHNRIEINPVALPELNKPAILTLYGLPFSNPGILRDGSVCPSTICTKISYSNGNLVFNVTQFSSYSAEETPTPPPSIQTWITANVFAKTWESLAKNTVHSIKIPKKFVINQILLETKNTVSNTRIIVKKLSEQPATVIHEITGVYQYLEVEHQNIKESNIKSAKIRFNVAKEWLSNNSYDENTVVLNRYYNDTWQKLATTKIGDNSTDIEYEAETPGFSIFAITAEAAGEEAVCGSGIKEGTEQCDGTDLAGETCVSLGYASGNLSCNDNCTFNTSLCVSAIGSVCGNGVCETDESTTTCPEDCPAPTIPSEYWTYIAGIIIVIILIIGAYWLFVPKKLRIFPRARKRKKR